MFLIFLMGLMCTNASTKHSANKLTKIKTLAKKLYFRSELVKSRQDMRKFWEVIILNLAVLHLLLLITP